MSDSKPMTASDRAGCLVMLAVMGGTSWLLSRGGVGFWGWAIGLAAALFVSFLLIGMVTSLFETKPAPAGGDTAPAASVRPRGRVCPRCGREGLPKVAKFCPVCGQALRKRRRKPAD